MTKLTLPAPREPAVDLRNGTFTRNWILYLQQSFERLGGSDSESITAITALVRQILQDIADNEVERTFSEQPVFKSEDPIEFSAIPVKTEDAQEPTNYHAQIAELRKQVDELQKQIALMPNPMAEIAEAIKRTKIAAAAQVTSGNVSGTQLIPWDTVSVQNGIKYDATTRRFTVPVTGNYLITASLLKLGSSSSVRVLVGVNTDSPTGSSNAGQAFSDGSLYNNLSVSNILSLKAGDYITFLVSTGTIYTQAIDKFNFCTIQLIG